jgi:ABC-2 type transport system ATP-binding protein
MDIMIETSGLSYRYGALTAVQDLRLQVHAGDLLALVGPDGAGKTTTLRLLAGILAPASGSASICGFDLNRDLTQARRHIGYAAQTFSLYPDLSVVENLAFFARLAGVPDLEMAARSDTLLGMAGLQRARSRLAGQLSGGMKQKLALACAMIHDPDVLLLDEPTTGVDPVSRRELWSLLAGLLARGKTIVLTTPYMDEAERCSRVALLDSGRLVALDTPQALTISLGQHILAVRADNLDRPAMLGALAGFPGALGLPRPHGVETHLPVADADTAMPAVRAALTAAGATNIALRATEPGLEDVFIAHAAADRSPKPASLMTGATRRTSGPAIAVHDLVRRFGDFTAVDRLSFAVQQGEIFGFLGPNGSGKTTTIRMICGILRPTAGSASVLGHDVSTQPEAVRQEIGYMSQRFGLYPDLSVVQNLEFYGGLYSVTGRTLRTRRDELVALAGLQGRERALAGSLSGGWRQRLALGCALIHRPPVVLLDEPTGGVDPASRRAFWDLIYDLAAQGTTILVTTHYMDEAEYCDRLALLDQGRLIALDTPPALKASLRDVLLEVRATPLNGALHALAPWQPALHGTALHLAVSSLDMRAQVASALTAAGLRDFTLTPIPPSMEDVFLALVSRVHAPGASAA